MINSLITFWHNLEYNIYADVIFALAGYLWGRSHMKKLHRRLDAQDAKMKLVHKHVREIHGKIHNNVNPS